MLDLAIILRSVQTLYVVELKSSLRTHLARCAHARRMQPVVEKVYYQPSPLALLTDCLNILLYLVATEVATP